MNLPTAPAVPCSHVVPCRPPSPSVAEVAAAVAPKNCGWRNWPLKGSSATTDQALRYIHQAFKHHGFINIH